MDVLGTIFCLIGIGTVIIGAALAVIGTVNFIQSYRLWRKHIDYEVEDLKIGERSESERYHELYKRVHELEKLLKKEETSGSAD